jgi:hypothetical protein
MDYEIYLLVIKNAHNVFVHVRCHVSIDEAINCQVFVARFQVPSTLFRGYLLKKISNINMVGFHVPA